MITGGKSFVSSPPAFSNDAKRLLVCAGSSVSIYSVSTGLQICELESHCSLVTSVVVVPASTSGSKVLCYCWTASLDGTIKYWDFAAPELMKTIDIHFPIHSMVIPGLLRETPETDGKFPGLFAYLYTRDAKLKKNEWQIRKCNLTKSRLVGGITLAEIEHPGSITISPSGEHIGIYEKRKLQIWEIPNKDSDNVSYKKIRLHHTKSFTTLAFHPSERVVAAGDATGRILLWRGVGRRRFINGGKLNKAGLNMDIDDRPGVRDADDADSCTTWHWHSSQVNVLFFSSDGAYLYSGGREGVLVGWQLDTGKKKFLPRIGSPLLHFTTSPDPSLASISCADNNIHLLRMPAMEIIRSISGIKLPSSNLDTEGRYGPSICFNRVASLIAVPTENYRVQLYSLFEDRDIAEVQICERNHHPSDKVMVKVNFISLSSDGFTMATVETRLSEEGIGNLVCLKFWSISQNKDFALSTVIYEPHRDSGVSSIAFRPTGNMAVSSSYGGDFKVWVSEYESLQLSQLHQSSGWRCHAVGSYKKKPMTATAFSTDGSVLAVATDTVITLWDPDRNILEAVIGDGLQKINILSFLGNSEYLVSASHGSSPQLSVWRMETLSAAWSYRLHVQDITCSMDGSFFAVLAQTRLSKSAENDNVKSEGADGIILLFNVENPLPVSSWFVNKVKGGGLSFVSHPKSETEVGETETSEVLAYVNGDHEYLLFHPDGETFGKLSISHQKNFNDLEETERFGYASIYGELSTSSSKRIEQAPVPVASSEKTWKTIFSGPSHSLPPLPKLCSDFLESLLERRPAIIES